MSVYTDGIHLVADSIEELHAFAHRMGLKRGWFQAMSKYPHYDLTTPRAAKRAIERGAEQVTPKQIIGVLHRQGCAAPFGDGSKK